ncbi:MAG TPA: hypothetical protein PLP73_00050 [Candidatus Absconditabacterales bacterium]|nr:hypothetical protein [Candidatus Absconditabacterales bacterium]
MMINYATDKEVRDYLDISNCSTDRIEFLLNKTTDEINSMIGDLRFSTKTEMIEVSAVNRKLDIYLRNPNVHSIVKINGKDYEGEKDKDYFVLRPQNRKVRVTDLYKYISNANAGVFSIEYESGYTEEDMPQDIVLAQCLMVAYHFLKNEGRDIIKYTMGPRTVQYSDSSEILTDIKKLLNRYKQLNLLP